MQSTFARLRTVERSTSPRVAKGAASSGLRSDAIGGIMRYQTIRVSAAAWRGFILSLLSHAAARGQIDALRPS